MTTRDRIIGTWTLVEFRRESADRITYPLGLDATGILIYTSDGFMSGQVMRPGRVAAGTSLADGYIAYCGTFRLDEKAGLVIHDVLVSLQPDWVGGSQERHYRFHDDNVLVLSAQTNSGAVLQLTWRRYIKNVK